MGLKGGGVLCPFRGALGTRLIQCGLRRQTTDRWQRVFCRMRIVECGKLSKGNLRKIKCGTFRKLTLSLFRIPQPKNSAFPRTTKLPFACIAQQMCNRCIPSRSPLKNEKNEKWFIGYSSSMLDCTSNKTLKQEHTIQNYNTPVAHNIQ